MFNDYARNMSKNIYDSKQEGTRLKILTPKQMLQGLPTSLAQIKAGNNSQNLLNEDSRTSEYHVLLLKLVDKLDLRSVQKSVALSNLSIYYTWKT